MADLPDSLPETERLTTAIRASRTGTKLEVVLLADGDGRVLIRVADSVSTLPDTVEALAALAQRIASRVSELGLRTDYETHFFDWEGRQVIGKRLEVGGRVWLLVVLCPPRTPYKQAMGRVLKAIETTLTGAPPAPKSRRLRRAADL